MVLKILMKDMTQGISEYHKLREVQNAPSVENVYNLYYSRFGKFTVLVLEDLTEFVSLKTLSTLNKNKNDCVLVARNCAAAVAELHTLGIMHGDLSSENILIHPINMSVKLIDLGCAANVGDSVPS